MAWLQLLGAISLEVIGTSFLKSTFGFSRLLPTVIVLVCYALSFFLLSLVTKVLPIGITYAVWSGVGIVFVTAIGYFFYGERLDLPAVTGIGFILLGVVVINLFSKTLGH